MIGRHRTGLDETARAAVRSAIADEVVRPPQREVEALIAALRERFGACFAGALYYGSCRRQTHPEGVIDLHVLVTDLGTALGPWGARICRLLPPNVYYLEVEHMGSTVRCKYAVLSLAQFHRNCTRSAFHSYFWARYAQPLSLAGVATNTQGPLVDSLVNAVETLALRALPRLPPPADGHGFWKGALGLCYRAELRAEGGGRAATLIAGHPEYYRATGDAVLAAMARSGPTVRARLDWGLRIALGKPLSLLRLIKGLYTFDGGLDYVAWKLERHTGRPVEVPDKVRRRPMIHLWPLIWKLWREGMFR